MSSPTFHLFFSSLVFQFSFIRQLVGSFLVSAILSIFSAAFQFFVVASTSLLLKAFYLWNEQMSGFLIRETYATPSFYFTGARRKLQILETVPSGGQRHLGRPQVQTVKMVGAIPTASCLIIDVDLCNRWPSCFSSVVSTTPCSWQLAVSTAAWRFCFSCQRQEACQWKSTKPAVLWTAATVADKL